MRSRIGGFTFVAAFFLTLLLPLYGKLPDRALPLGGVTAGVTPVERSVKTLWSGDWQSYAGRRYGEIFPGRNLLVKLRNQFYVSVLRESPNENVLLGKKGYLYEPGTVCFYLQTFRPESEEYFEGLGEKLSELKQLTERNGKELYVFLTPAKVDFLEETIPDRYMAFDSRAYWDYTNREALLKTLEQAGIPCFDSVQYLEDSRGKEQLQAPFFYASGMHWSRPWGSYCAKGFLEFMRERSRYDFSRVTLVEEKSDTPVFPDTDLYDSLNLLVPAKDDWYTARLEVSEEGRDHPNVFFRGGSFLGQSTAELIRAGVFGEDVHLENNNLFRNRFTQITGYASYTAYDEMPLGEMLPSSDILVLEINESSIHVMGFGFIEYLLEHPELMEGQS